CPMYRHSRGMRPYDGSPTAVSRSRRGLNSTRLLRITSRDGGGRSRSSGMAEQAFPVAISPYRFQSTPPMVAATIGPPAADAVGLFGPPIGLPKEEARRDPDR